MVSSFSLLVLLVAALISTIGHAAPFNDSLCEPRITTSGTCSAYVSVDLDCTSSTLNLFNTTLADSCSSAQLLWYYPKNNLTLIIETPYTRQKQPYSIYLDTEQLKNYILHVYRISQGQEREVTKTENIIEKSDSNYQVILKFQAPTKLEAFGAIIPYDIVKN